MKAEQLLQLKGIDATKPVLEINRLEVLENLLEAIKEFCPNLKVKSMSKNDLEIILDSLGNTIVNYHPENYHQERAALLANSEMLKKYGLTDQDIQSLDFV
ncbi:MAG: hypothetical protein ISS47_04325 [Candidatus Omnitrophica bacterium]|nr:hypothetical protein [Candidatus Omnitrophota bacterium]